MNKKLITALAAISLSLVVLPTSKAEEVKPATLAIIDTAVNSNLPDFKNNIVYEACVLSWPTCQNKTASQEGYGAASMPIGQMMNNGFNHGNEMVSTAISTNPNIKIVFVRFVGATATGDRQITNEMSFVNALSWVYSNRDKFNIRAVAMSQSHHNLGTGANYCPNTPLTSGAIKVMSDAGIPVFFPAGNDRDIVRVSWPACIPSAVTVSASAYGDGAAIYTNYDANITDIFARGDMTVLEPNGTKSNAVGSSVSNQVAAASYIALANKYPSYSSQQLMDLLKTKTTSLVSRTIKGGRIVNTGAVLNG